MSILSPRDVRSTAVKSPPEVPMFDVPTPRRFPIGAEPTAEGTHFRVWAPARTRVEVVPGSGAPVILDAEPGGYFSGLVPHARAGTLYRFRLDGGESFPDPVSRFQPEGPHGPSQVVDPAFAWADSAWTGASLEGQVITEIHIGTFTREGTWNAAASRLSDLADCGITAVEVMPVADFPGRFGWGYDGVSLYAPVAIYGTPGDFRRFVDTAHRLGLAVLLDVVYNHIGPDGNYLKQYSADYFTDRYPNEWGEAINYDGENSAPVREWVSTNAAYWAAEYHIDGLRLDATQQIFDYSPVNIQTELTESMRAAARSRRVFIVAENESQQSSLARPRSEGGVGLDGLWNDDFHHSAHVALTGHNEAYYSDYLGRPQEFISAAKYGYLFQGQRYHWQSRRRGEPSWGLRPWQFINYIDNHDQIANSAAGLRTHLVASPGRFRAVTALMLLAPGTPMLFQGQEFGSSSPFHFFADHHEELRVLVRDGRIQFLSQFPSLAQPEMRGNHRDPGDAATFEICKLDWSERDPESPVYRLHRDLLHLRRNDPVFRAQRAGGVDGAVLSASAFILRYFGEAGDDRLLVLNFGCGLRLNPAPEPLLAPPAFKLWTIAWSSENLLYGGCGTPPLETSDNWQLPAQSAIVLRPMEPANVWAI